MHRTGVPGGRSGDFTFFEIGILPGSMAFFADVRHDRYGELTVEIQIM